MSPDVTDLGDAEERFLEGRLLSLVDTKLVLGYRYNERSWDTPSIEDANAVQGQAANEFGQAHHLMNVLDEFGADITDLERRDSPGQYHSMDVLDEVSEAWPRFLAVVGLADVATQIRLQSFADGSWPMIAEPAAKAVQEEAFHVQYLLGAVEAYVLPLENSREAFGEAARAALPGIARWFGTESDDADLLVDDGYLTATPDAEREALFERLDEFDSTHLDGALFDEAAAAAIGGDIDWTGWDDQRSRTGRGPPAEIAAKLAIGGIDAAIET